MRRGPAPAGLTGTEYTIVGLADSPPVSGHRPRHHQHRQRHAPGLSLPARLGLHQPGLYRNPADTDARRPLYSEEYDQLIEEHAEEIAALCRQVSGEWYQTLLTQSGLTAEQAAQGGLAAPQNYVLTRAENSGYISFENDTSILSGIANIFPLFFILIALLVCITTMTRHGG